MFPSHQEPVCLTRGFIQNCFLRNDHASRLANVRPKTELHQKISEVRALDQAPHTSSHVESRRITRNHANFCLRTRFRKSNHAQSRSITWAYFRNVSFRSFFLLDFTYDTFPLTNLVEKKLHFFTRKYFQWNVTTWFIRLSIWLQHTVMVS